MSGPSELESLAWLRSPETWASICWNVFGGRRLRAARLGIAIGGSDRASSSDVEATSITAGSASVVVREVLFLEVRLVGGKTLGGALS